MTELRLEGVTFDYPDGTRALDGVDLVIEPGSSLALVGANGSGKTTLARHLDGLLRPSSGRVADRWEDAAGLRVAQLARSVGLCFQQPDRQIFGSERCATRSSSGRGTPGAETEAAFARATDALARVGMADQLGAHPDDLGETRRKLLTIASVLAMETPVVVLDEPTTGLDARGVELVSGHHPRARGRRPLGRRHQPRHALRGRDVRARGRARPRPGRARGQPADVFAEPSLADLRAAGLEPTGGGPDRGPPGPGLDPDRGRGGGAILARADKHVPRAGGSTRTGRAPQNVPASQPRGHLTSQAGAHVRCGSREWPGLSPARVRPSPAPGRFYRMIRRRPMLAATTLLALTVTASSSAVVAQDEPLKVFGAYATQIEEPWDGVIHAALNAEAEAGSIDYTFADDIGYSGDMEFVLPEDAELNAPDVIFGDAFGNEEAVRASRPTIPTSPSSSAPAAAPPTPTSASSTTGSMSPPTSPACSRAA